MKYILILFALFSFISCSNYTHKNSGRLIIDKNLTDPFFGYANIGVIGGENSNENREIITNADVRELNQKHPPFDSCNSIFQGIL